MAIIAFALITVAIPAASVSEDVDATAIPGATNLSWEISSTGKLTITNSNTTPTAIPDYTSSSSAPWNTAANKGVIKSIDIGEYISGIGSYAFYGLTAVTNVVFPSSLTSIGESTFQGCTSLSQVVFVNTSNETSMGKNAFCGCSSLKSINLQPAKVTSIGIGAFGDCTSLEEITIQTGVTAILDDTFEGCSNLSRVSLPEGLTTIGNHAFADCLKISSINIPSTLTSIEIRSFSGLTFFSGSTEKDPSVPNNLKGKTWYGSGTDAKLYESGLSNEYKITFEAGVGATSSSDRMTTVNGKLPSLPIATSSAEFDGWFISTTGGSIITTSYVFTENTVVYALWGTAVPVDSVELSQTSATLYISKSLTLTATVKPTNATDKTVSWSSSDPSVATVESGIVTPLKVGTTTITVTTNYGAKTATCVVNVQNVPVDGVTLNKTSVVLSVGDVLTLIPTISPSDANIKTVTWDSSNKNVANVDASGKVTAIATGETIITVKTDVGEKTASCNITVATHRVTGITMDSDANMNTGGKMKLNYTISPTDADIKTITWSSNDTDTATVDSNGEISALKAGSVVITATTVDGGFTKNCTVTITDSVFSATTILIIVVIAAMVIAVGAVFYLKKSGTLGGNFGGKGGKKKNGGDGSTGVTPLRPINKP